MKNISVQDCAKLLDKSYDFVTACLQAGTCPFGFAVRHEGGRWGYYISPRKLAEWVDEEEIKEYYSNVKEG